jgi:hypothetical protein
LGASSAEATEQEDHEQVVEPCSAQLAAAGNDEHERQRGANMQGQFLGHQKAVEIERPVRQRRERRDGRQHDQ